MSNNIGGNGQGPPRMSRLQWEQKMEERRADLQDQIDRREVAKITRALANSRQQNPNGGHPHQVTRQPVSRDPSIGRGAPQAAAQPPARQHPLARTAVQEPAAVGPHIIHQQDQQEHSIRRPEQPEMVHPMPHGLPYIQHTNLIVPLAAANGNAGNQIDLTGLSDGEDIKSPRLESQPSEVVPVEQRTRSPVGAQQDNQLALPNDFVRQQPARSPLGANTGHQNPVQRSTAGPPPAQSLLGVQPENPLNPQNVTAIQQPAQSLLGVQLGQAAPRTTNSPSRQPSNRPAPPPQEKQTPPHEPPYKEELPTVIKNPNGDGYVELRCPVCGGNSSSRHNAHGQMKFFVGASGVRAHYRICHPGHIQAGQTFTLLDTVLSSTHRTLTEAEVQAMLAKTAGTYAIGHYRAAASEPDAKIRASRERQKPKQTNAGPKKSPVKKRSRSEAVSKRRPAKQQAVRARLSANEDDIIYENADVEVNQDDDENDDELPTKKRSRRS